MTLLTIQAYQYLLRGKLTRAFPAFRYRNYRLYFGGQLISLIGTWMQQVAQGWLVWELTRNALWVGVITALATLPVLLLGLFGGVIVDRFSIRKILLWTNGIELILAAVLGILTITGVVTIWHIATITFLFGVVTALDTPGRQALANEVVDKKDLHSAIALGGGMYNSARIVGPMIAAISIVIIGKGGVFLLNAASFIPALIGLYLIRIPDKPPKIHKHLFREIQEGVSYAYKYTVLRILLLFAGILAIFGWTYMTIIPVFAGSVFNTGSTGLGLLYSSAGLGAVAAAVFVSAYSRRIKTVNFIFIGVVSYVFGLTGFSLLNNMVLALPFLLFVGFGLVCQFTTMNTIIQHIVKDELRGRVLSIYTIMFMGLSPIGSIQVGWFAERFSPSFAIQVDAAGVLLFGVLLYTQRNKIQAEYLAHITKSAE